jgi:hypothetical protein
VTATERRIHCSLAVAARKHAVVAETEIQHGSFAGPAIIFFQVSADVAPMIR